MNLLSSEELDINTAKERKKEMSREIKFRGKTYDGKWIAGYLVKYLEQTYIYVVAGHNIESIPVIPETIGQFTGLHDKNGVEIYEGDKVSVVSSNLLGDPIYKDNMIVTEITDFGLMYALNHANGLEVIGNIYESEETSCN